MFESLAAMLSNLIAHVQANPMLLLLIVYIFMRVKASAGPFPESGPRVHSLKNQKDFEDQVAGEKCGLCIVDFYATWCPPCKAAVSPYTQLSETHTSVSFFKVNVDEVRDVAQHENISSMPTFKIYKKGICVGTVNGCKVNEIENFLNKAAKNE